MSNEESLKSVRRGKPPLDCPVIGTWSLQSYVRERLSDGHKHNQFGDAPTGCIGYAADGRMYAIFTRNDRVMPRDVVPTDEEGVELIGSMVAYAGTFSIGDGVVVHHIDTSWNQHGPGRIKSDTSCLRVTRSLLRQLHTRATSMAPWVARYWFGPRFFELASPGNRLGLQRMRLKSW